MQQQQVQADANFTVSEVEDLRELHGNFVDLALDDSDDRDNYTCMKELLSSCEVPKLSVMDMRSLAHIVHNSAAEKGIKFKDTAPVPFSVFMAWMKDVFQLDLGGLMRSEGKLPTTTELQGRRGFAAAVLREHARQKEDNDLHMNTSLS